MNKIKYILAAGIALPLLLSAGFAYSDNLENFQKEAEKRSKQANQLIQYLRDKAQDKVKQKRDLFSQKIAKIKDIKRQDSAKKISSQLEHINQTWTNHFTNVLDKLDAALQKIKSRTQKAESSGKDVSLAKDQIKKAQDSINSARGAVANQAQQTYVVDTSAITQSVSTDAGQNNLVNKLRDQFKIQRDDLFSDLKALRDGAMKEARSSVHDSFLTLSNVPGVNDEPK